MIISNRIFKAPVVRLLRMRCVQSWTVWSHRSRTRTSARYLMLLLLFMGHTIFSRRIDDNKQHRRKVQKQNIIHRDRWIRIQTGTSEFEKKEREGRQKRMPDLDTHRYLRYRWWICLSSFHIFNGVNRPIEGQRSHDTPFTNKQCNSATSRLQRWTTGPFVSLLLRCAFFSCGNIAMQVAMTSKGYKPYCAWLVFSIFTKEDDAIKRRFPLTTCVYFMHVNTLIAVPKWDGKLLLAVQPLAGREIQGHKDQLGQGQLAPRRPGRSLWQHPQSRIQPPPQQTRCPQTQRRSRNHYGLCRSQVCHRSSRWNDFPGSLCPSDRGNLCCYGSWSTNVTSISSHTGF